MISMRTFLVSCALLSTLAVSASVFDDENLFPTTIGSTWTWTSSASGAGTTMKVEVVKADPPVDGQALLRYTANGQTTQDETYLVTKSEVARLRSGKDGCNHLEPALPIIEYPMTAGKSWHWKGTITTVTAGGGGLPVDGEADLKVAGREDVKTDAGTFNAYRVDMHLTVSVSSRSSEFDNTYWFAPNVGMVKQTFSGAGLNVEGAITSYSIK